MFVQLINVCNEMCSVSQLPIRIIFCFPFYSLSLYIYNGYGEQCKKIKVLK